MGIFDRLFGNKTGQNTVRKEKGDIDVSPTSVPSEEFSSPSGGKNEESMVIGGERFIFTDLTVKDKETGLVWTRDANIAGRDMDWHKAEYYITQLNGQRYAGYNDWRIPKTGEIKTLLDYARSQGARTFLLSKNGAFLYELLNKKGFKNVQSSHYWLVNARIVDMWYGSVFAYYECPAYYYVWPVRSGLGSLRIDDDLPVADPPITCGQYVPDSRGQYSK